MSFTSNSNLNLTVTTFTTQQGSNRKRQETEGKTVDLLQECGRNKAALWLLNKALHPLTALLSSSGEVTLYLKDYHVTLYKYIPLSYAAILIRAGNTIKGEITLKSKPLSLFSFCPPPLPPFLFLVFLLMNINTLSLILLISVLNNSLPLSHFDQMVCSLAFKKYLLVASEC